MLACAPPSEETGKVSSDAAGARLTVFVADEMSVMRERLSRFACPRLYALRHAAAIYVTRSCHQWMRGKSMHLVYESDRAQSDVVHKIQWS
jgi:hypothetical protein